MSPPVTSPLRSETLHPALFSCLVLIPSAGLLDLLLGLLTSIKPFATFSSAAISVVITMLFFLLLYSILWLLSTALVLRKFAIHPRPFAISLAVLLLIMLFFASQNQFNFRITMNSLVQWSISFLLCITIAVLTYISSETAVRFPRLSRAGTALWPAFPFLLAGTIGVLQLRRMKHTELSIFLFPAFLLLEIALVVATLWFFHRYVSAKSAARLLVALSLLLFLTPFVGLFAGSPSQQLRDNYSPAQNQIRRVILITIDTLRQDGLSLYHRNGTSTPNIEMFARDAVLYKNAVSEAPWTMPAMASIFTGVSPLVHLVQDVGYQLPPTIPTLAEYMKKSGYYTVGIGSNILLEHPSFSRGFIEYKFFPSSKKRESSEPTLGLTLLKLFAKQHIDSTEEITRLSNEWLRANRDKSFFMWIHYFDPHLPYTPPRTFAPGERAPSGIGLNMSMKLATANKLGFFVPSLTERNWIKQLYLAEIRYVDQQLGAVLKTLKETGLYDDSMIILTSDHGEEFWEHGKLGHSHSVYQELLQVPLIIKFPNGTKGHNEQQVSTVQIMPTILDTCGIANSGHFSRKSLRSAEMIPDDPIISTGVAQYDSKTSVLFGNYKYIKNLVTNRDELYDLSIDAFEQNSILPSSPELAATASSLLEKFQDESARLREVYKITSERKSLDEETEENLRALGYVQ